MLHALYLSCVACANRLLLMQPLTIMMMVMAAAVAMMIMIMMLAATSAKTKTRATTIAVTNSFPSHAYFRQK